MNKNEITPDRLKEFGFKEWDDGFSGQMLTIRNLHYVVKFNHWYYKREQIHHAPTTIKEVEALYSGLYGEKLIQ
jgi:hypothetical protein